MDYDFILWNYHKNDMKILVTDMFCLVSKNYKGVFQFTASWSIDVDTVNSEKKLKLRYAQFCLWFFVSLVEFFDEVSYPKCDWLDKSLQFGKYVIS